MLRLSLAEVFLFFPLFRPMIQQTEPNPLMGSRHPTLTCGDLRVLTFGPASGSEDGCRNPETPTIFFSIFIAQFQYSPIFSSFSQRVIQSQGTENVSSSTILTSASSSCTFGSLVQCDGLHLLQHCRGLFKY